MQVRSHYRCQKQYEIVSDFECQIEIDMDGPLKKLILSTRFWEEKLVSTVANGDWFPLGLRLGLDYNGCAFRPRVLHYYNYIRSTKYSTFHSCHQNSFCFG